MQKPQSYCEAVAAMEPPNPHIEYHNREYGFPLQSDDELFGRLVLEINQAGLSWTTILNKKDNFYRAYDEFKVGRVAAYGEDDIRRLLNDAGIIRNKLKVAAAIHNAGVILELQRRHGSFRDWLDAQHPLDKAEWVKLFKKTFRFTGGEITNEFLMSTGYLPGAHVPDCPVYHEILRIGPKWRE